MSWPTDSRFVLWGHCINSLTAKSVRAGAKLVLFGRYVLNFYVGIVLWILRETKTWRATIYLATQCTNRRILTSPKRYDFDPLLTSWMLQGSYKLRASAAKMRSLRVQRAIKLCERIKIWQETTVPWSLLKSWCSRAPIAVKLLKSVPDELVRSLLGT